VTAPHIEPLAVRALEALDYLGVAEVEILFEPISARANLVEINARPWLQFALPHACGYDLLGHALGRAPAAAAPTTRNHR